MLAADPTIGPWATPFLRWAGSKRALLPMLTEAAPRQYDTYVEPFMGSACLFFALRPKRSVLGDFNADLVNAFSQVKDHPRLVHRGLHEFDKTPDAYYDIRTQFRTETDSLRRAQMFIYLNRMCFNGVYRTNRDGHFNTPVGRRTGAFPTSQQLYRAHVALRSAELAHGDFRCTLSTVGPGDFVYLDPPYMNTKRSTYGEYGYGSFDLNEDLADFLDMVQELHAMGTKLMISYSEGTDLDRLVVGWKVNRLRTRRSVAAKTEHRVAGSPEILTWNY